MVAVRQISNEGLVVDFVVANDAGVVVAVVLLVFDFGVAEVFSFFFGNGFLFDLVDASQPIVDHPEVD